MDIHQQIKTAREKRGWSMEQLAKEISKAEGVAKPLSWQTIQQWENGTSAPKRTRMELVRQLLELDPPAQKGEVFHRVSPEEWAMLQNYRRLLDKDRKQFDTEIAARAEERQAEADELFSRYGVVKSTERAHARKSRDETQAELTARLQQEDMFDRDAEK